MIDVTEVNPPESALLKARQCFVRRVSEDSFLVTPRRFTKTRRLVKFTIRYGHVLAKCKDYYRDEICPANEHGILCYHVLRAIQHGARIAQRREKKQKQEHPEAA